MISLKAAVAEEAVEAGVGDPTEDDVFLFLLRFPHQDNRLMTASNPRAKMATGLAF